MKDRADTRGGEPDVRSGADGFLATEPLSARQRFVRRFRRNRSAVVAVGFLGFLLLVALFESWIMPYDPDAQNLGNALAGPFSEGHLLGTDELGRDMLSRLISGTRVAFQAASLAVAVALLLSVLPGLVAGYFGGVVDGLIMRITDALQSFPPLILAIAMVGILGPNLRNAMIVVGVIFAPNFVRIVRASAREVRLETFVEASVSIGSSTGRIIRTRVLPNALPPLLVQTSLALGFALLAEASLSFIGLGVQLPQASWGLMLGRGYSNFSRQPWTIVWPGLAIASTVLAFNVVGDGLRDSIGREVRKER